MTYLPCIIRSWQGHYEAPTQRGVGWTDVLLVVSHHGQIITIYLDNLDKLVVTILADMRCCTSHILQITI